MARPPWLLAVPNLGLCGAQSQRDNPRSRAMVPEISRAAAQRQLQDLETVAHQRLTEGTRSRLVQKRWRSQGVTATPLQEIATVWSWPFGVAA
jgi:hypothetical protein